MSRNELTIIKCHITAGTGRRSHLTCVPFEPLLFHSCTVCLYLIRNVCPIYLEFVEGSLITNKFVSEAALQAAPDRCCIHKFSLLAGDIYNLFSVIFLFAAFLLTYGWLLAGKYALKVNTMLTTKSWSKLKHDFAEFIWHRCTSDGLDVFFFYFGIIAPSLHPSEQHWNTKQQVSKSTATVHVFFSVCCLDLKRWYSMCSVSKLTVMNLTDKPQNALALLILKKQQQGS